MPVSQRLLARKVKRGSLLRDRSFQPILAPMLRAGPLKSNGREACRSMIAPSEPSSFDAEVDLRTVTLLNSSEAKIEKSNWRPRLAPPELSLPPVVARASRPFRRTTVKSGPRPRTVMVRPSPPSRSIDTPGTRCSDSARFRSGKSAMSCALMTSTRSFSRRLMSRALARLARKPVTTTSSTAVSSVAERGRFLRGDAAPAIASAISMAPLDTPSFSARTRPLRFLDIDPPPVDH
jgi:hypothetical protein